MYKSPEKRNICTTIFYTRAVYMNNFPSWIRIIHNIYECILLFTRYRWYEKKKWKFVRTQLHTIDSLIVYDMYGCDTNTRHHSFKVNIQVPVHTFAFAIDIVVLLKAEVVLQEMMREIFRFFFELLKTEIGELQHPSGVHQTVGCFQIPVVLQRRFVQIQHALQSAESSVEQIKRNNIVFYK